MIGDGECGEIGGMKIELLCVSSVLILKKTLSA
jgi:hypothetical protein